MTISQVRAMPLPVPVFAFGDRVRKIRRDLRMNQEQFAGLLDVGVGDRAIAAWESGRSKPDDILLVANRIELVTGIPAPWVLGYSVGRPNPDGSAESRCTVTKGTVLSLPRQQTLTAQYLQCAA